MYCLSYTVIYGYDADVILGHNFLGASLDVLLHQMFEHRVDHWPHSRFKRNAWITIERQGTDIRFLQRRRYVIWLVIVPSLFLSVDSLVANLQRCAPDRDESPTTWSLTEMCRSSLKVTRQDIDPEDRASYLDVAISPPTSLIESVQHCELDTFLQMAITSKVQILPPMR